MSRISYIPLIPVLMTGHVCNVSYTCNAGHAHMCYIGNKHTCVPVMYMYELHSCRMNMTHTHTHTHTHIHTHTHTPHTQYSQGIDRVCRFSRI